MADENTDAGAKLQKLGQRLRAGLAKQSVTERSLETVRGAVREQWEQEQAAKRDLKPDPSEPKNPQRQPEEPER